MRIHAWGDVSRPTVAVVGVYDPLLPEHRLVLDELCDHARRSGLGSLAIMINPDPGRLLFGAEVWPVFNDWNARVRLMLAYGIDGVLLLRFFRQDLFATAPDFFQAIGTTRPRVEVRELWLGAKQLLGSGMESTPERIAELAAERGILLRRLPEVQLKPVGRDVRRALSIGCIGAAREIAGHCPVRSRPPSGHLRLAWQPGEYRAVPLDHPADAPAAAPLSVRIVPEPRGLPSLAWPDPRVRYLAFLAGPGDRD